METQQLTHINTSFLYPVCDTDLGVIVSLSYYFLTNLLVTVAIHLSQFYLCQTLCVYMYLYHRILGLLATNYISVLKLFSSLLMPWLFVESDYSLSEKVSSSFLNYFQCSHQKICFCFCFWLNGLVYFPEVQNYGSIPEAFLSLWDHSGCLSYTSEHSMSKTWVLSIHPLVLN